MNIPYLAEDSLVGTIGVVVLLIVIYRIWLNNQTTLNRNLLLACLCLLPIPTILDRMIETPKEAVNRNLQAMVTAARNRQPEPVIARLDPSFKADAYDRDSLASAIREEFTRLTPTSVSINGLETKLTGDGTAESAFVVVVAGQYRQVEVANYPLRLRLFWKQAKPNSPDWNLVSIKRFPIVGDQTKSIDLRSYR